jgi:hypothetical protein
MPAHPLRNFRVDDETWQNFVAACKKSRSNASAELTNFVKAYIEGFRLNDEEYNDQSEQMLHLYKELEARVSALEKKAPD